jgi:SAM-dependent methyltransferase
VLEIGCGAGRLGETLKQRQPCEVVGVELNLAAAEKATRRLDRVMVGDIERLELDFGGALFDCLICADLLEHLVDPAGFLRRARAWLTSDAVVIASLPNVRHRAVVEGLMEGNWCYEPAGLLDNTHLHFFTRRDVEALFIKAGYRMGSFQIVPGPGYEEPMGQEDRSRLQIGRVALTGLPEREAEEFFAYQFLVKAERSESIASHDELPRCLLLMVTYNRLEYTRLALEAVLKLDYKNLRLVVWDNASSDGTVDYIKQRLASLPNAELIASPVNRGVVFPMNEVWSSDWQAELLAKIDNDTLVPPGLLSRLAACHLQSKRFGVLSGFHFREEGERLAEANRIKSFDGVPVLPQPYVGGCAVMIRRDVFDRIGPIGCRTDSQPRPFMDSGWTRCQQRLTAEGLVNGYPWPRVHVDHMEDTRSAHCIRSDEHQRYKREERGMELDEFTNELCVWRPNWSSEHAVEPSSSANLPPQEGINRGTFYRKPPQTRAIALRQDIFADVDICPLSAWLLHYY